MSKSNVVFPYDRIIFDKAKVVFPDGSVVKNPPANAGDAG